jgi:outer membrane protein assembly factor BamB
MFKRLPKFQKNLLILAGILAALVIFVFLNSQLHKNKIVSKTTPASPQTQVITPDHGPGFAMLWWTDFNNNRVIGFTPDGQVPWAQNMSAPPIPRASWYFIGGVENVTVAPNGNLITVHGDGMMVQEIDRQTHELVWQYGTAGIQTFRGGVLDEPDKSYKFNDHEVVINDGNDREVVVVDQNTNQVVWQYGQYHQISSAPGLLRGNTSVRPVDGGKKFLITDTLANRIILVDRATKDIVWQYTKPDAKWLQNVSVTQTGDFILEDRQKGEVFAVNRAGQIVWDLTKLSDENSLSYPTDTAVLDNGNILIAESGRNRIVEVVPSTGQVVRQYLVHGFVSTIAIDNNDLAGNVYVTQPKAIADKSPIVVQDAAVAKSSGGGGLGGGQTVSGEVSATNPSTGRAGSISLKDGYGAEIYNYSRVVDKNGAPLSLMAIQKGDKVEITGTVSGTFIRASLVKDDSR